MQRIRITDDCGWRYYLEIDDRIIPELAPHVRKIERLEDSTHETKRPTQPVQGLPR